MRRLKTGEGKKDGMVRRNGEKSRFVWGNRLRKKMNSPLSNVKFKENLLVRKGFCRKSNFLE